MRVGRAFLIAYAYLPMVTSFIRGFGKFHRAIIGSTNANFEKPSITIRIDSALSIATVDLSSIGEEIVISPSENGVKKIVMKFGGSSLATADRVVYVAK